MTETVLTEAISATPLANSLAEIAPKQGLAVPLFSYLGAFTPSHFAYNKLDAPVAEIGPEIDSETRFLLSGAAMHDLGWLRRVAVRGEDRFRWLSGMVTNVVEILPDHAGTYNLVLNAQGRIQGDAYVWREGENLELELIAEQSAALLAHFDHFIIMDDVELAPLPDQFALGLTGPQAEEILAKLGLPPLPEMLTSTAGIVRTAAGDIPARLTRAYGTLVPHYAIWVQIGQIPILWEALIAAGATPVGALALETLRVIEGIPGYGVDIQSRDLAHETSQTRALNFTKGCYLGQEIVERIRSRGQVHRHLRRLELTQQDSATIPQIGSELRVAGSSADSKAAGTLTSITSVQLDGVRRIFAIGMIRAEAEVGNRALTYPEGTARILNSPPKLTLA